MDRDTHTERERERERERMERRLSEAAIKGSVESLISILQQDPLILDKAIASCTSQSPLHQSSLLGHLDFTTELLIRKPEFAAELDSEGSSPLHLAAAKGHLEIVKRLLLACPETSMVRNSDGRTPLHAAAIKGRVEVVAELARVVPESTRVVTDRGETGLHLCVRHNRVEALKFLVEIVGKDGELVNCRDCEGNTILHIAVAKKQTQIINFLFATGAVEVNALNRNGSTSLDILKQSPRDLRDSEIEDSLLHARGLSTKDLHLITDEWVPRKGPQIAKRISSHPQKSLKKPIPKHEHTDWLDRKRSALMVVASLIATVAFQAGLTPPGGVWQDNYLVDSNGKPVDQPHTVGTAVIAYKDPLQYGLFMIFNTTAFLASLSIILLLVSGLPLKRRRWMWLQMVTMWISITAQVLTYFLALRNMSPKSVSAQSILREVTQISVLTWLCLMLVVFIGNIVRMNLWVLRKFGYIKEKERKQEDIHDGEEE